MVTQSLEIVPIASLPVATDNVSKDFQSASASSSNIVTFVPTTANEATTNWVTQAESMRAGLDVHHVDNLVNEAIENIQQDAFLPSAMDRYLNTDHRDSVALNPVEDDVWSEFDFSLFEVSSNNVLDANDDDANATQQ